MSKNKKKIIIVICTCLIFVSVLWLNTGVCASLDAGGALCISFDKWDMLRADKIIVGYRGETYTVTDTEFIREFAKETLAGSFHEYCCSDEVDGWVEIYRGERLLRRMRYISNHDAFAYDADITHWVLFGKEGHSFLSKDVRDKLHEIISS